MSEMSLLVNSGSCLESAILISREGTSPSRIQKRYCRGAPVFGSILDTIIYKNIDYHVHFLNLSSYPKKDFYEPGSWGCHSYGFDNIFTKNSKKVIAVFFWFLVLVEPGITGPDNNHSKHMEIINEVMSLYSVVFLRNTTRRTRRQHNYLF